MPVRPATWERHIVDREVVDQAMAGVTAVVHAATLHKLHVATHSRQAFVDTNVTGTLSRGEEHLWRDHRNQGLA